MLSQISPQHDTRDAPSEIYGVAKARRKGFTVFAGLLITASGCVIDELHLAFKVQAFRLDRGNFCSDVRLALVEIALRSIEHTLHRIMPQWGHAEERGIKQVAVAIEDVVGAGLNPHFLPARDCACPLGMSQGY